MHLCHAIVKELLDLFQKKNICKKSISAYDINIQQAQQQLFAFLLNILSNHVDFCFSMFIIL